MPPKAKARPLQADHVAAPAGKRAKYNSYGAEDVSGVSAYSNGMSYAFTPVRFFGAYKKRRHRPLSWALLHLSAIKAEIDAGLGTKKIFSKYVTPRKNLGWRGPY